MTSFSDLWKTATELKLPAYFEHQFQFCRNHANFANARILEIGGSSIPRKAIDIFFGAKLWVSVDLIGHLAGSYQYLSYRSHYDEIGIKQFAELASDALPETGYLIFNESATSIPEQLSNRFDICVSFNAFEHILDLPSVITQIHRCLREGGTFIADFGPIWSCRVGSHFWISDDFNFNKPAPLPAWAHLLMTDEEIVSLMQTTGRSDDQTIQLIKQLRISDFINRRFYEDYLTAMQESAFKDFSVTPTWCEAVPEEIQARLEAKHGKDRNYGAYGMRIVAKKERCAS